MVCLASAINWGVLIESSRGQTMFENWLGCVQNITLFKESSAKIVSANLTKPTKNREFTPFSWVYLSGFFFLVCNIPQHKRTWKHGTVEISKEARDRVTALLLSLTSVFLQTRRWLNNVIPSGQKRDKNWSIHPGCFLSLQRRAGADDYLWLLQLFDLEVNDYCTFSHWRQKPDVSGWCVLLVQCERGIHVE